jgi:hypothetical protein
MSTPAVCAAVAAGLFVGHGVVVLFRRRSSNVFLSRSYYRSVARIMVLALVIGSVAISSISAGIMFVGIHYGLRPVDIIARWEIFWNSGAVVISLLAAGYGIRNNNQFPGGGWKVAAFLESSLVIFFCLLLIGYVYWHEGIFL